ncbi:MAG: SRPBCC domain-containing protein [Gemmatimonadota bacterium]
MPPLTLELEGDTHIIVTRSFAAPPELVYRAHLDADLLQQWMLGPPGWTMPVCVHDPTPGGAFRYEWANDEGETFTVTGEFLELEPHSRILHRERMHVPDPTPDNVVETRFEAQDGGTLMTQRMTLPDAETRQVMLDQGMEEGMEGSYARLDPLFAEGGASV